MRTPCGPNGEIPDKETYSGPIVIIEVIPLLRMTY